MKPVRSSRVTGTYGAPHGLEKEVGGLPYYRERDEKLGTTIVWSDWMLEENEIEALRRGEFVISIGIVGLEPIPPIAVRLTPADRDTSND